MRHLAQNMRNARQIRKWTQAKAANVIGISRPSLGSYEEDRVQPPAEVLIQICKAYGIKDVYKFVTGKMEEEINETSFERLFNRLDPRSKKAIEVLMGVGLNVNLKL